MAPTVAWATIVVPTWANPLSGSKTAPETVPATPSKCRLTQYSLPGRYDKITVACYYATGVTIPWVQFDSITFIEATERTWGVLQVETEDPGGPYLRCHSASSGSKTTYSPEHIKVTVGKPDWVNLHFEGEAGTVSGAVFDPASGFAQVGPTMVAKATAGAKVYGSIRFGQTSAHGNHPDAKSQSYFSNIIVDYTRGAFPLLPSGPAAATAPAAGGGK